MARSKSTTDTTPQEENTVSDTIIEEVPEATEAPAEPKAEKPKVDHEGLLTQALIQFGTDKDAAALQEVYRAVPAAARGKVQGVAMRAAMDTGLGVDVLGEALDAFMSLPAASKTTRARTEVDPTTAGAVRLHALMKAYDELKTEFGDDSHILADQWFQSEVPTANAVSAERVKDKIVKAATSGNQGGGPRTSYSEKLIDLISDNRLPIGAVVEGAGDAKATVVEGGLEVNGEVHAAPTAAAKLFRTKEDGKQTSTNGWDFWTLDGKPIGNLRTK